MDTLSEILFHAHSGIRYLVLLAGLLALVVSLTAGLRQQPWDRRGRLLLRIFVGVMDLQVLLGLILIFFRPFYGALWGHIVLMVLAAAAAHGASVMNRRRPPERQSHWVAVVGVVLTLALIVAGILALPGRSVL